MSHFPSRILHTQQYALFIFIMHYSRLFIMGSLHLYLLNNQFPLSQEGEIYYLCTFSMIFPPMY